MVPRRDESLTSDTRKTFLSRVRIKTKATAGTTTAGTSNNRARTTNPRLSHKPKAVTSTVISLWPFTHHCDWENSPRVLKYANTKPPGRLAITPPHASKKVNDASARLISEKPKS